LLIVLISILGYFTKPGAESRHDLLKWFSAVAPGSASTLVNKTLDEISAGAGKGKISLGLAAALWASSSGVAALMKAFNAAFGLKETRFWLKRRLAAVAITVLFTLLIFAALLLILAGDQILNRISHHFGMQHLISQSWSLLQWPLMLGFVLIAFDFLYCFAPNFPQAVWRWLTPGASVAIAMWLLASFGHRALPDVSRSLFSYLRFPSAALSCSCCGLTPRAWQSSSGLSLMLSVSTGSAFSNLTMKIEPFFMLLNSWVQDNQ
jgi:membrane protein